MFELLSADRRRIPPLLLNGEPERFVLTVTVNFSLRRDSTHSEHLGVALAVAIGE